MKQKRIKITRKHYKNGYFIVVLKDNKRVEWRRWNKQSFNLSIAKQKYKQTHSLNPDIFEHRTKTLSDNYSRGKSVDIESSTSTMRAKKGQRIRLVGEMTCYAKGYKHKTYKASSGFMENYGDLDSAKKHIRDKCIKLYMLDRGIGSDVHVETYGESFYYEGWTYHDLYQSQTVATT